MRRRKSPPLPRLLAIFAARTELAEDCWVTDDRKIYVTVNRPGMGGQIGRHKLAYELAIGPVPEEMLVLHRCDNPPCFNPAHLFVGTQADNMRDARSKGRKYNGEQRPTHCKRGHELTPANTYTVNYRRDGIAATQRLCKACHKERGIRYRDGSGITKFQLVHRPDPRLMA